MESNLKIDSLIEVEIMNTIKINIRKETITKEDNRVKKVKFSII